MTGCPPAVARVVRFLAGTGVVAATVALAVCSLPFAASAAPPSHTSFTFSGTVHGTLTQANGPCSEIGTYGGQFEFFDKLKGSKDKEWTVNVNNVGKFDKVGGTFKKFTGLTGNGVSVVLSGSNGTTDYYWISKSGSISLSATSGKIHVKLVPDQSFTGKPGKGTIELTGSWGCTAS